MGGVHVEGNPIKGKTRAGEAARRGLSDHRMLRLQLLQHLNGVLGWKNFTQLSTSDASQREVLSTIPSTEMSGRPSGNPGHFSFVLTPDRIPQFTIPSLDLPQKATTGGTRSQSRQRRSESIQRACANATPGSRHAGELSKQKMYSSDCCLQHEHHLSEYVSDHPDPATRAAMSLPHLPKVKTPYGFIALTESPHVRRKESLFFDDTCYNSVLSDQVKEHPGCHPSQFQSHSTLKATSGVCSKAKGGVHRGTESNNTPCVTTRTDHSTSWKIIMRRSTTEKSSAAEVGFLSTKKNKLRMMIKKHIKNIHSTRTPSGLASNSTGN
uniref:Uncharacterized protein n=1 Tax=Eptatretus burgeri TaxID=7764 RepID=A0A8C4QX88_EPTBU